jgi:olefin beta-lactone synthetase
VTGPVITVGHDWGGPISLAWSLPHHEHLQGIVLINTAVHQPSTALCRR